MRHHRALPVRLLPVLASIVAGCAPEPAREAPPNIVYLLADDLGYGELGAYGQTLIRTPNLDRLAAEGMKFTQHYAGSPVCAPSRNTLLTGFHTGHTQVRDNYELGGYIDEEERGQMPLDSGTYTIGRMLQDAGYVTAAIGKWGLGGPGSVGEPNKQGIDYFLGYLDQKQAHNYYPTHLWRNGERFPLDNEYFSAHQPLPAGADPNDPASYDMYKGAEYSLDVMSDDALRFIRENAGRRFFLYVPFTIPHLALQVPDSSADAYEGVLVDTPYVGDHGYLPNRRPKAAYAGMISRMDAHIGRIMALLEELGLDDNTIVMFSSDNGTTYTGGISFLPTLLGRDGQREHASLYWEYHGLWHGAQAVRMGNWKGVRLGGHDDAEAPIELYDLESDIGETTDVSAEHPDIVARVRAVMESRTPSRIPQWNFAGSGSGGGSVGGGGSGSGGSGRG